MSRGFTGGFPLCPGREPGGQIRCVVINACAAPGKTPTLGNMVYKGAHLPMRQAH